jgi:hypothetical protein
MPRVLRIRLISGESTACASVHEREAADHRTAPISSYC